MEELEEAIRTAQPPAPLAADDLAGIIDITFAYRASRVVHTANQLNVFNILASGPATAAEVAPKCECHPRSLELLLNACVAIGLLEKTGDKYKNAPLTEKYLVEGKPTYLRSQVDMQRRYFEAQPTLLEAVRTGKSTVGPYHTPDLARSIIYQFNQAANALAPMLPDFLDLTGRSKLFAAGDAAETLALNLVQRTPGLRAEIMADLEGKAEGIREFAKDYDLLDRITIRMGHPSTHDFGQGNDAVVVMNGLQINGVEGNTVLAKRAFDSMVSGGIYAVAGYIMNNSKTAPRHTALWALTTLPFNPSANPLSAEELMGVLRSVGFVDPVLRGQPSPLFFRMMISHKP